MVKITIDGNNVGKADIKASRDIFYVLAQLGSNKKWKNENDIKNKLFLIHITNNNDHNKKQIEYVFKKLNGLFNGKCREIKIDTKSINDEFKKNSDHKGLQFFEQSFIELEKKNKGQKGQESQGVKGSQGGKGGQESQGSQGGQGNRKSRKNRNNRRRSNNRRGRGGRNNRGGKSVRDYLREETKRESNTENTSNSSKGSKSSNNPRQEISKRRRQSTRSKKATTTKSSAKNSTKSKNTKKISTLEKMRGMADLAEQLCDDCKNYENYLNKELFSSKKFNITQKFINRLKKSEKTCKNCLKACKYIDHNLTSEKTKHKLEKDKDIFKARYPRICRKEGPNESRRAYKIQTGLRNKLIEQYKKINK